MRERERDTQSVDEGDNTKNIVCITYKQNGRQLAGGRSSLSASVWPPFSLGSKRASDGFAFAFAFYKQLKK